MDDIKYFIKGTKFFIISLPILLIFIILISTISTTSNEEIICSYYLKVPFSDETKYHITSYFGTRIDPVYKNTIGFHRGIDISAPVGTDILASADGVVYKAGYDNELGNYVYIKHDFDNIVLYTLYGHMLDNSIVVSENDIVTQNQKIGTIGSTGKSTGIHLHFAIYKNNISNNKNDLINPITIFENKEE